MSVKKKDRHKSNKEPLEKSRKLVEQILILVRQAEYDRTGKRIQKAGILGEGQPLQVFGLDLIRTGKRLHAECYEGCNTYLRDKKTLKIRSRYFREAIECCDNIYRQIDLCISQYGKTSNKKRRSFEYLARLNREVKMSLQDRLNRDNLIYQHVYKKETTHRRGR